MKEGELIKVRIEAYRGKKAQKKVGQFDLPINPEGYSYNYKIKKEESQAKGKGGNNPKYSATESEKMKLDFYLDNTGTVENNKMDGKPVPDQIDEFLDTVYRIDEETHKPPILKIVWGGNTKANKFLAYTCILEDVAIEYKLFASTGEPLRAKVTANFIAHTDPELQERCDDKRSPDLTKVRKVQERDTLPLMTYNLYGDSKYYWQIAEVNQLTTFRRLNVGQDLVFPPIQKASE